MTSKETPSESPAQTPATDGVSDFKDSQAASSGPTSRRPATLPWWVKVVPFFISAFFFMSVIFAVFSPLPLLFLFFRSGRKWAWLATLTNSALVLAAAGPINFAVYAVFIAVLAMAMAELLSRRNSVEKSATLTLLAMLLAGGLILGGYAQIHHVNPVIELKSYLDKTVDYLVQNSGSSEMFKDMDPEEIKHAALVELPSGLFITAIALIWANFVFIFRVNPGGFREKLRLSPTFLKNWKAPDNLVWPTILCGFFLLWGENVASEVAGNIFRVLMAVYALQGLSVLAFFFDQWGVRGVFRTVGFMLMILLMRPLLLSLGFFDLWFDFRAKFRQS